jgi:hypothetical protein
MPGLMALTNACEPKRPSSSPEKAQKINVRALSLFFRKIVRKRQHGCSA